MVDSQYGSCFMLIFWHLECWCGFQNSGNFVHPTYLVYGRYATPPQQHVTNDSFYIRPRFCNLNTKDAWFSSQGMMFYFRTWRGLCRQQTDFVESAGRQAASVHTFHFLSRIILHLTSCSLNSAFFCATYLISPINVFSIPITLTPLINQVSSWERYIYGAGEGIIPPSSHLLLPRYPSPFVTSA
jgi:hypothetical protein